MRSKVYIVVFMLIPLLAAAAFTGCTGTPNSLSDLSSSPVAESTDLKRSALPDPDGDTRRIHVISPSDEEIWNFTEAELVDALQDLTLSPQDQPGFFAHIYSTINNWPASKTYAAEGYSVASILAAAGLYDTAQRVTFRGEDGYEVSLSREQFLAPQSYYPQAGENEDGAARVYPLIAYRWREGAGDLGAVREDKPSLIIGQRNPFEHTNPAFVVGVAEILVSEAPCEVWPAASTFPLPGAIARGETVKLQHSDYGLVKLHYTLDGSEPTTLSKMYNPSTYQPELNVPIPIMESITIKVLVSGYGKLVSEVVVFEFVPQD
jgi:hypothetical protein